MNMQKSKRLQWTERRFLIATFMLLALKAPLSYALEWQAETVDTTGGHYTSLDLTPRGWPHISYYGLEGNDLKYAYKNRSGWQIQQVDTIGNVGAFTSLELDFGQYPHISYVDLDQQYLKYAFLDPLGWHFETVDSAGVISQYTSLDLDSLQNPHISCIDDTEGDLKYAHRVGSAWVIEVVDSVGMVHGQPSLTLDQSGCPHISYIDLTNFYINYAHKNGGEWQIETVDSTMGLDVDLEWGTSMVLDNEGHPHIVYCGGYYGDEIRYARRNQTGDWHIEYVDCWYTPNASLALDEDENPHIVFRWVPGGLWPDLKYAWRDVAGWHTEHCALRPDPEHHSLILDGRGILHISVNNRDFMEGTNELRYCFSELITGIGNSPQSTEPKTIQLLQIAPNPAMSDAVITYGVSGASELLFRSISLRVYDALGRCVATPTNGIMPSGVHSLRWSLLADDRSRVPAGVYYLRIQTENTDVGDVGRLVVVR